MLIENMTNYIKNKRIPVHATLQLTYNCNFKCVHCFQTPIKEKSKNEKQLSKEEWFSIIDILKNKKCVFITFTGGEVFTMKNFMDIYMYAYQKNFKIKILTNASLLSNDTIKYFSKYKPAEISISLYGFSNKSYLEFTKKEEMFDIVKNNISQLKNNEINIKLKCIAHIFNKEELAPIKDFADSLFIPITFYYKMRCYTNGNCAPKQFQIPIDKALNSMENIGIIKGYIDNEKKYKKFFENGIRQCSNGTSIVCINNTGSMFLCSISMEKQWPILKYGFDYCWEKIGEERKKEIEVLTSCSTCSNKEICGMCAPMIKNDHTRLDNLNIECLEGLKLKNLIENTKQAMVSNYA